MKKNRLTGLERAFVLFCFALYLSWCLVQPYEYGPDEVMRFQLPEYIYEFGRLPNGFDKEMVTPNWGFSYAFYPCWLGPLCSAFFMKVMSVFSQDFTHLLLAARFTSVLSGTLTVYFAMKGGKLLFRNYGKWIFPVMVGMLPQFVFLSTYVNNDVIAIMGSAVIFYAWCLGREEWNKKSCLFLAAGVIVVALSYYNAYGWVLGSMILFLFDFLWETGKNRGRSEMWKRAAFTAAIVLVFISYFFIRNAVIYDGDLLGMSSLTKAGELYAVPPLKPSLRNTPANRGLSLGEMLTTLDYTGQNWYQLTFKSFVGVLGCMWVYISDKIYFAYGCIFAVGISGYILSLFTEKRNRNRWLFEGIMVMCFAIPILLSLYYSYFVDYQAQGRYCMTMVIALWYFVTVGGETLLKFLERFLGTRLVKLGVAAFLVCVIVTTLRITAFVYLPSVGIHLPIHGI